MKLNGMAGKGTGKLGSMVYATVRGAQIVRQYNPVVYNPNTEKQATQRAKFSLLTKVAAMVSPALVFQGRGPLISNRNAFIKANFGKFEQDGVTMVYDQLALTSSNVEGPTYPQVSVNSSTRVMTLTIEAGTTMLAGFGYAVAFIPNTDDGKVWAFSGIVPSAGQTSASATVTMPQSDNIANVVVIGYPMYYKDSATRVAYDKQILAYDMEDTLQMSLSFNRMASQGDIIVYATKELVKTT